MNENRKRAKEELLDVLGRPGNTLGEARELLKSSGRNLALSYDDKSGAAVLFHIGLGETFQMNLESPTFHDLYHELTLAQ